MFQYTTKADGNIGFSCYTPECDWLA